MGILQNESFETIEMQKIRFAVKRELDLRDINSEDMRIHFYETMTRDLVLEIEGFIWAQTVSEPYEYQVPVSPTIQVTEWLGSKKWPLGKWQLIKWMFFPQWLINLFPIKYSNNPFVRESELPIPMKTETLDIRVIYPKMKIACPQERTTVKVMRNL